MTCTVLAHKFDATQLYLRTCLMLRNFTFAHVGCYAISLAHMFDATQLHLRTCSIIRHCICAHVRCYAIALAHMLDATQFHLRTCSMLRNCTCAHVRCYATALAHMFDATQLHLRREAKECLQMSANFSKRGSSNGQRAELLRVNPHLSTQQFLKHLAKVC